MIDASQELGVGHLVHKERHRLLEQAMATQKTCDRDQQKAGVGDATERATEDYDSSSRKER